MNFSNSKLNIISYLAVFLLAFFFLGTTIAKAAPPTVVITTSPGTVTSGSASTLTWNTTDSTSCTASGDWSGSKAVNGSESTGALTIGKSYTLTCTGPEGTASAFTFVTIGAAPTPSPTVVITASPGTVTSGTASTLTWNSTDATSCTASGDWSGAKAVNGSESTGALTTGKTYNISCTGAGGTATAFTFVTISSSAIPPTVVITASPGTVTSGSASTLTWTSTNATSCTASGDWSGAKAVSGSESTGSLTINKTYTITCTGPGGTATAFTVVTVTTTTPTPGCTSNCGGGGGGGSGIIPTSDIFVSKTVNRTTANVGDVVLYTIQITNNGPYPTNDVTAVDKLPVSLSFISASTTSGYYSSSLGMWFAGSLNVGSSTTLMINAIVKNGFQGQLIRNTVEVYSAQSDPNPANNTAFVDVNATQVTPPAPTSCYYLFDYLRKDFNNNPVEVRKLQVFLRDLEGFSNIQITGVYDDQTIAYLNAFQSRYASDILTPWGHTAPTGYTYILTKKKVNEIYCRMAFPVTPLQQQEIDNYRHFLLGLKNAGIQFPSTGIEPAPVVVPLATNTPPVLYGEVGVSTSTPGGIMSRFTANVRDAWGSIGNLFNGFCSFLNWLLLLIIIIISYLWYRDRENARRIAELNKDLSLK